VKGNVIIHPTALVDKEALIGPNVVIGPNVKIDKGNYIYFIYININQSNLYLYQYILYINIIGARIVNSAIFEGS
jgi:NDP-sugar pyrophosphorylase family protein